MENGVVIIQSMTYENTKIMGILNEKKCNKIREPDKQSSPKTYYNAIRLPVGGGFRLSICYEFYMEVL